MGWELDVKRRRRHTNGDQAMPARHRDATRDPGRLSGGDTGHW